MKRLHYAEWPLAKGFLAEGTSTQELLSAKTLKCTLQVSDGESSVVPGAMFKIYSSIFRKCPR